MASSSKKQKESKKGATKLDAIVKAEHELFNANTYSLDGEEETEVLPDHLLDLAIKHYHKTFVLAGMDAIFSDPYPFDQDKLDALLASFRYLKGMNPQLNKAEIIQTYKDMLLEACQHGKIPEITKAFDEYVQSHTKAITFELRNFQQELCASPYYGFLFIKMKLTVAYLLSKETLKKLMDESLLTNKKEDIVVWMFDVPVGLTVLNDLNKVPKLPYSVEGNLDLVFFERKS